MQEKITGVLETIIATIPPGVTDAIRGIYHTIDPLWWWVIEGVLVFLLLMIRFKRSKGMRTGEKAVRDDVRQMDVKKPDTPRAQPEEETPQSFFDRLKNGLSKTRKSFSGNLERIFSGDRKIEDMLEEIEELLITSDIGVATSLKLIESISKKSSEISDIHKLKAALKEEILSIIGNAPLVSAPTVTAKPHVILVVGVNGVGKTTTIGKLAAKYTKEGKKVLISASDTFRAAAIEQLTIWAERAGAEIVKHKDNSDPSAVAYDSIDAALAREMDIVIVDTAGRLHTKKNLMEEVKKIRRTIAGKIPDAPHETLLVLDATTGQNALSQAKIFLEAIGVTGIVLTKLDGTAKGGIVVGICSTLNIPLKYIGVGEMVGDLQEFDPKQFVEALF